MEAMKPSELSVERSLGDSVSVWAITLANAEQAWTSEKTENRHPLLPPWKNVGPFDGAISPEKPVQASNHDPLLLG